jgi:hypothetical protein
MACPDGCGEQLTINLDSRSGPAWRCYQNGSDFSLFPSVWRNTGCRSHFIVWRSNIYWCDWHDELDAPIEDVVQYTLQELTYDFVSYIVIADKQNLVPWAVLSACTRLCQLGLVEEQHQTHFRKKRVP